MKSGTLLYLIMHEKGVYRPEYQYEYLGVRCFFSKGKFYKLGTDFAFLANAHMANPKHVKVLISGCKSEQCTYRGYSSTSPYWLDLFSLFEAEGVDSCEFCGTELFPVCKMK